MDKNIIYPRSHDNQTVYHHYLTQGQAVCQTLVPYGLLMK